MELMGKTAVITGSGSGLGFAIARSLHQEGVRLVLIGRDMAKLDRARDALGTGTIVTADLLDHDERERLVALLLASDPPVDILVNNAGTMQYFALTAPDAWARLDAEIELDFRATAHLATALLPHLLARPQAAIVNVTTGLVYTPFGAAPGYGAAKAGLHAFTRSLRWQTKGSGLGVLEVLPPTLNTGMSTHYEGRKLEPADVAATIVKALARGTEEIRLGQAKLLYAMSRIAPDLIFRVLNNAAERAVHR